MFARLKRLWFGDQRPIVPSVTHPLLGELVYSADDEAWLSDPKASNLGFGFFISGDWNPAATTIRPAAALIEHAAEIASNPEAFAESVRAFLKSQLTTVKRLQADREEIERLQIHRVALMWPEHPDDGEIELRTSPDSERMWHCAYLGRKPSPTLSFSGLDI